MSFWVTTKAVRIKEEDIEILKEVLCEHGFQLDKVPGQITKDGRGVNARVEVSKEAPSMFNLGQDNDAQYSQFTREVGQNGGTVLRDFVAVRMEREAVKRRMTVSKEQGKDGKILLRMRPMRRVS